MPRPFELDGTRVISDRRIIVRVLAHENSDRWIAADASMWVVTSSRVRPFHRCGTAHDLSGLPWSARGACPLGAMETEPPRLCSRRLPLQEPENGASERLGVGAERDADGVARLLAAAVW